MVAVVVVESQQSFAKHYGEEEDYDGEGGQRCGIDGCGYPPSTPLYIGGREEGWRPRSHLGGGGQGRWGRLLGKP